MDLKTAIRITADAEGYLQSLQQMRAEALKTFGDLRKRAEEAQASWKAAEQKVRELAGAMDMSTATKGQVRDFDAAKKAAAQLKDAYQAVQQAAAQQRQALAANATQQTAAAGAVEAARAAQQQVAAVEAAQRREVAAVKAAKEAEAAEERRLAAVVANSRASMAAAAQQQLEAERRAYAETQAAAARYAAQVKADAAYRAAVLSTQDSRDRFARQAAQRQVADAPVQLQAPATAQLSTISSQLALARNAALAIVGAQSIAELVRMVDGYTQLAARLRLVTSSTQQAAQAQQQLFAIAQRNGVAMNDTAGLFLRIARPMREMGASQAQTLAVTEAVAQSLRISGSNAQESAAAMQQFAQALGAGVVNGDELRSVLENAPRLAQAVADGLGVPVGKLRELGEQGSLTSAKVLQAIQTQAPAIRKEAEQIPLTISAAITQVQNAFAQFVGTTDSATGASRKLAEGLAWVARNIETVVSVGSGLAASFILGAAIRSVVALAAAIGAIPTILVALTGVGVAAWMGIGDGAADAEKKTKGSLDSMTEELDRFGGKLDETARNDSIKALVSKIAEAQRELKEMSIEDAVGDPGAKLKESIAKAQEAAEKAKKQNEDNRKNLTDERGKLGLDKLKVDGTSLLSKGSAEQLQAFDRTLEAFKNRAINTNSELAASFTDVRVSIDGLVAMAKSPAELNGLVTRLQAVAKAASFKGDVGLQNTLANAIEARATAERNALDASVAGLNTRLQRGNALVQTAIDQARIAASLATGLDRVNAEVANNVPAVAAAQAAQVRAQVAAVQAGAAQQLQILDRLSAEKLAIIQKDKINAARVASDARIDADRTAGRLGPLKAERGAIEQIPAEQRTDAQLARLKEIGQEERRIAEDVKKEKTRIREAEANDAANIARRIVDLDRSTAQERLGILRTMQTEAVNGANEALNAYRTYAQRVKDLDKQIAQNRLDTQASISALQRRDMAPTQQADSLRADLDRLKAEAAGVARTGDAQGVLDILSRQRAVANELANVQGAGIDPKEMRAEAIDNLQRIGEEAGRLLQQQRAEAQAAADIQKKAFEDFAASAKLISAEIAKINAGEMIRLKTEIDTTSVRSAVDAVRAAFASEVFQIRIAATAPIVRGGFADAPAPIERATGGAVFGPGGPTSDSIPAWLSNGEHVFTAAEVRAAGGHQALYAMRSALLSGWVPRFAEGGAVTRLSVPQLSAPAANDAPLQPMNVTVPGVGTYSVMARQDVAQRMRDEMALEALKYGRAG